MRTNERIRTGERNVLTNDRDFGHKEDGRYKL